jgi:hypothetical protein
METNMSQFMRRMMGLPESAPNPNDPDPNLLFYMNEIESRPDGALIDMMHEQWWGDFDRLEMHHGYIQWLFPVFEAAGMNWESSPLTKDAAKQIRESEVAQQRVLKSYKLMLNFYGFKLADEITGRLERDPEVFEKGIDNLNKSSHNYLRISRILISLGELGFHRYKRPLLEALTAEVDSGTLSNAARSLDTFWRPLVEQEDSAPYRAKTLEDPEDRAEGCLFRDGGALHRFP